MRTLLLSEAPEIYEESDDLFEMTSEFGLLVSGGNTSGTTLTSKVNIKHNTPQWSNRYSANVLFSKTEQQIDGQREMVTSAQRVSVSTQSDYKLEDPTNRLFLYGEYEDDRFSSYRYQASFALGWAEQLWKSKSGELRYSIGPGYAIAKLKPEIIGRSQMGMIVRAALEFEKKLNSNATFRQLFSTETDDEFSRSISETSLAAKINGSLKMKLSVNMTHNRRPDQVDEALDTQTSVTVVYHFF